MQPLNPIGNSVQTTAQPREVAQPKPLIAEPQQDAPAKLQTVVNQMSEVLAPRDMSVGINVDSERNSLVIVVTDNSTGEMIRQIPSEEALRRADRLSDAASILFNDEA